MLAEALRSGSASVRKRMRDGTDITELPYLIQMSLDLHRPRGQLTDPTWEAGAGGSMDCRTELPQVLSPFQPSGQSAPEAALFLCWSTPERALYNEWVSPDLHRSTYAMLRNICVSLARRRPVWAI